MMIAHITGTLVAAEPDALILDVAGVGYRVFVSPDTKSQCSSSPEEPISLWTHLAVRETALDLYGFVERTDLDLFELLIDVPGIGPKSALATLSLVSADTLRHSIVSGDTTYLTKVSGIGKKTAEKIVLELKDKLGIGTVEAIDLRGETDAVEALRSLGYSLQEAREALKLVPTGVDGTGERVREALRVLGKEH